MKRKSIAIILALVLALSLTACGKDEETTLSGMVVSVNGTVISLVEMDESMRGGDFEAGEIPEMPEGMEGFGGFDPGSFDPDSFEGTMPEGGAFPQWGEGEMPEGMNPPEGMTPPEGATMPENGQMPDFSGRGNGMTPGSGNFASDMETKDVDIADAHISVEIEGGKESGSLESIQPGTFVTITLNGKGEGTYVLVSSRSFFGGGFGRENAA